MKTMHLNKYVASIVMSCITIQSHALIKNYNDTGSTEKKHRKLSKKFSFCLPNCVIIDSGWILTSREGLKCLKDSITISYHGEAGETVSKECVLDKENVVTYPMLLNPRSYQDSRSDFVLVPLKELISEVSPIQRARATIDDSLEVYLSSYDKDGKVKSIGTSIAQIPKDESSIFMRSPDKDSFIHESLTNRNDTILESYMDQNNPYDIGAPVILGKDPYTLVGLLSRVNPRDKNEFGAEHLSEKVNTWIDGQIIKEATTAGNPQKNSPSKTKRIPTPQPPFTQGYRATMLIPFSVKKAPTQDSLPISSSANKENRKKSPYPNLYNILKGPAPLEKRASGRHPAGAPVIRSASTNKKLTQLPFEPVSNLPILKKLEGLNVENRKLSNSLWERLSKDEECTEFLDLLEKAGFHSLLENEVSLKSSRETSRFTLLVPPNKWCRNYKADLGIQDWLDLGEEKMQYLLGYFILLEEVLMKPENQCFGEGQRRPTHGFAREPGYKDSGKRVDTCYPNCKLMFKVEEKNAELTWNFNDDEATRRADSISLKTRLIPTIKTKEGVIIDKPENGVYYLVGSENPLDLKDFIIHLRGD